VQATTVGVVRNILIKRLQMEKCRLDKIRQNSFNDKSVSTRAADLGRVLL